MTDTRTQVDREAGMCELGSLVEEQETCTPTLAHSECLFITSEGEGRANAYSRIKEAMFVIHS